MKLNPFKPGMPYDWLPSKILLIMRLVIIIMITCFMQVSAASFAQRFTYGPKKATLAQVFAEIKKQTGFRVLYSDQKLDDRKVIAVNFKDAELLDVMDLCLKDQELVYELDRETILIKAKEPSFPDRVVAALTDTDISCRVLDADGKALPGASVSVKGKNKKVSTDKNGKFVLKGVEDKDILVISYIGYQPLEILVKDAMLQENIVLKEVVGELDEVKLIGYGTTTQRLATGNTSRITAADIEKQPVANPLQTLQGRMPGVLVTNGQGLPGTETKIQIRGINSISGNRNPLYIVDGVPFSATALYDIKGMSSSLAGFQNAATSLSFTPFNSISPSEIESIDVLKDADATAIYGSRGANGVILITTKKGTADKTEFDISISQGIEYGSHFVKGLLSTPEYLTLEREGAKNDGYLIDQDKDNFPELFLWDKNETIDWQKLILGNTGNLTSVNGSFSGGNSGTTFLLGGNYRQQGTIYPGDLGFTTGGSHFTLNHNSQNGKFFISATSSYSSDKNSLVTSGLPIYNTPNFPLYNGDGKINFDGGNNYLASLMKKSTTKTDNLIANAQIGYHVNSELTFTTGFGFNRISLNGFNFIPLASLKPSSNPINSAAYANQASKTYNMEPQLDYKKMTNFGKIIILVGGTYQSTSSQGNFISGENYKDENLFESIGAAGRIRNYPAPATTYTQYKYVSVFGRVNYNIKDRYILNINYRRDGSSRFGPGKRFGNFSSVGGAWIFSNEGFLKKSFPFISYGKLRTSYGSVGNQPTYDYQFLQTYISFANYQGNPGLIPSRIANPDFRWEVNKKLELGLDIGLLNDRLLLSSALFNNRSDNQLVNVKLPSQTGFSGYIANLPAIVENKGLEISLTNQNLKNRNFSWSTNLNISFINNKLVSFPGIEGSTYEDSYEVGKSLSIIKNFLFAGVDPETGNALYYNKQNEKIPNPSNLDYRTVGNQIPEYYGGINNNFKFKGFELDFLIQFVKQAGYRPGYSPGLNSGYYLQSYMQKETLNRWQSHGDITNVPKASLTNYNTDFMYSSFFWSDASYIKLKNISLTYLFPNSWRSKLKAKQLKAYIQGQNLLTITKYKGSDPEIPSSNLLVPTLTVIAAGLQLIL